MGVIEKQPALMEFICSVLRIYGDDPITKKFHAYNDAGKQIGDRDFNEVIKGIIHHTFLLERLT